MKCFYRWDDCSNHRTGSPLRTMTIQLDEYLALFRVVRNEWKEIELKLTATARQLANTDQLVSLTLLVTFFSQGSYLCLAKIGSRLVLRAWLELRQAAVSAGITFWLELNGAMAAATVPATGPHNLASAAADADPSLPGGSGSGGGSSDWKEMEIPFLVLVAMANCEDFWNDMYRKLASNCSSSSSLSGSSGSCKRTHSSSGGSRKGSVAGRGSRCGSPV
jgi:hypothetical protein